MNRYQYLNGYFVKDTCDDALAKVKKVT